MFHKGWWGTVWYTRCAVLWGRGEGGSIKAGGVPCGTSQCQGNPNMIHVEYHFCAWQPVLQGIDPKDSKNTAAVNKKKRPPLTMQSPED